MFELELKIKQMGGKKVIDCGVMPFDFYESNETKIIEKVRTYLADMVHKKEIIILPYIMIDIEPIIKDAGLKNIHLYMRIQ